MHIPGKTNIDHVSWASFYMAIFILIGKNAVLLEKLKLQTIIWARKTVNRKTTITVLPWYLSFQNYDIRQLSTLVDFFSDVNKKNYICRFQQAVFKISWIPERIYFFILFIYSNAWKISYNHIKPNLLKPRAKWIIIQYYY